MLSQLDKASKEYVVAKEEFDAARVSYEVARETFTRVRQLARAILSNDDWWHWAATHSSVQYTGLKIGDAIIEALENRAFDAALDYWSSQGSREFYPALTLEALQEEMERGGFEFRSSAPLREVNAALINLDPVQVIKDKNHKTYTLGDANKILEFCRPDPPGDGNAESSGTAGKEEATAEATEGRGAAL